MSSVTIEMANVEEGIKIAGDLDADDFNNMKEFEQLLSDPSVTKLLEDKAESKGLMKDYCVYCHRTGEPIEFRAWSFVQAMARGMIECGGSCQVNKGKCP